MCFGFHKDDFIDILTPLLIEVDIKAYKYIDGAEQESRNGNLPEALEKYRRALDNLNVKEEGSEEVRLGPEVIEAIKLLRQDINDRVRDIEALVELQRPTTAKSTSLSGTILMNKNSSSQNVASVRPWDVFRGGNPAAGMQVDPLLLKILNKLQNEIIAKLEDKIIEKDCRKGQTIESIVNQSLMQFGKDLAVYEQKNYKEFNARLEKANNENKKLSNQIVKLRERWDSLVESAKQRRTRQQDNLNGNNSG